MPVVTFVPTKRPLPGRLKVLRPISLRFAQGNLETLLVDSQKIGRQLFRLAMKRQVEAPGEQRLIISFSLSRRGSSSDVLTGTFATTS
jgi:hypothetical protein